MRGEENQSSRWAFVEEYFQGAEADGDEPQPDIIDAETAQGAAHQVGGIVDQRPRHGQGQHAPRVC